MVDWVSWGSLATLALLLIVAAVGDVRRFTIPNWLCLAVALLSLPYWWASGAAFWPGFLWQAGFAVAVFAGLAALFAIGVMGGGDVKLLAALALWFPPRAYLELMMLVAVAGGLLTLALLVRHRVARAEGRPEIPYGLAIAAGAFLILAEPLVKQFPA
ncbi:prepilin peptidase [Sphingoaurantiacus capsulatus]|uniref:Prepilin peptidase n=1 Tax=Sphingoaurantiacus capsulatus TaxID=1771310 RepID=A0ABV7X9J9_9SPHN